MSPNTRLKPLLDARNQRGRVEEGEDPAKGVVRGDAVGQVEELAEKGQFGLAEAFDIDPAVGAAESGTEGQDDDIEQRMTLGPVQAWVCKFDKVGCKKFSELAGRHPSPPGSSYLSGESLVAPLSKSRPRRIIQQ